MYILVVFVHICLGFCVAVDSTVVMFNLLTPTVAIWVQLATIHLVPDWVKLSFVIFDIVAL